MLKPITLAAVLLTSLTGCGTLNTLPPDGTAAGHKLAKWRSHCDAVPRIYSGVMLDFCRLNAAPPTDSTGDLAGARWMIIDITLSGIADTLVLPYTIYLQSQYGSIQKSWHE
jgi:uncharacterized protein YceK